MSLFCSNEMTNSYMAQLLKDVIENDLTLAHHWWFPLIERVQPNDFTELKQWFESVDKDKSGTIELNELKKARLPTGATLDDKTILRLMRIFDVDYSGDISFTEFIALWKFLNIALETFSSFDGDKSGSLDRHELDEALNSLGFSCSKRSIDVLVKMNSGLFGKGVSKNHFIGVVSYLGQCRTIYQETFKVKKEDIDNHRFSVFVNLVLGLCE